MTTDKTTNIVENKSKKNILILIFLVNMKQDILIIENKTKKQKTLILSRLKKEDKNIILKNISVLKTKLFMLLIANFFLLKK